LFARDNFQSYQDLEAPSYTDLATSAVVYDATFSGYNSIALGTFGKAVLIYSPTQVVAASINSAQTSNKEDVDVFNDMESFTIQQHTSDDQSDVTQTQTPTLVTTRVAPQRYQFTYELKRELFFKHSILGLTACELSLNGGASDLVVATLNGVSVWRYDPDKLVDLINRLFEAREQYFVGKYSIN
jgi:hypothetical protein